MIVLVSGATTTVAKYADHPALGRLVQPRSYNRIEPIARSGMPWGADNDAIAGVNPDAYLKMLDAIARGPRDHLKFVTAPDAVQRTPDGIVGSWEGTLWLWRCWRPALVARGLPPAIVLQDGATPDTVPWDELSAVFVGASTRWKLSRMAGLLVRLARARGLWTHIGRVNTFGRLRASRRWGRTASTARSSAVGPTSICRAFLPASSTSSSLCWRCHVPHPNPLIFSYLGAIIVANILVSRYGPAVAVVNSFLFIGLDLSTRDRLHEQWQGRTLWPKMLALIVAGGLLSLLLGGSGRVALASCLAFILAGIADTVSYRLLQRRHHLWRVNGSNLVAAIVDSLCFPLIAFGWPILWSVVLGQFIAKVLGGALWAWLLLATPYEANRSCR